ncbi:MAG: sulfurtransferase TusA family protein [Sphingomonadales bacterium]
MAEIDTSGLICPLPVLRARKALQALAAGEILEVRATDPAAVRDFPAFCESAGHILVHAEEDDGVYIFRIAKKKVL